VAGRPFPGLTADQDVMIKLLDRSQAASEEDFKAGKVYAKGVKMLHQFMDPVEVRTQGLVVVGGWNGAGGQRGLRGKGCHRCARVMCRRS